MRKSALFLLFIAFVAGGVFTSCHKTVDKNATDFIGTWIGASATNTYQIVIKDDGTGTYTKYALLTVSDTYTGKVRYYDNTLQIDKEKFDVNQIPTLNGSIWSMQIESIMYVKQ